jgi:hypothetical protein
MFRVAFVRMILLLPLVWTAAGSCAQGAGLTWPTNQLLPTFPTPATIIDCIDVSSASGAEQDLFASLEGIVNRTQPQIACMSSSVAEGEFTWLNIHNLRYNLINGYYAITKYKTNLVGLVVTDTSQPDTLNLATTIAGVKNELICDPSLLARLTNAPYNLTIMDDLRGKFSTKYQVYGYLYSNYWSQCTHRIITGMETNGHGQLRDYIAAVKSAAVWLDGGVSVDATALAAFLTNMAPVGGVWMGWVSNEGSDLQWIAQYGIPVLASDWFDNGSLFGGVSSPINIPAIPPAPALLNKIYVSIILSDGDNVQYMQHTMMANWTGDAARGSVPIGWTTQPLATDLDPGMLNYYWSTATTNDCLLARASGSGYTRINYWSTANENAYTKASASYLQRGGQRIITVYNSVSRATAKSFASNCPTTLGLIDQGDGYYTTTNYGTVPVIGYPANANYSTNAAQLVNGITNTAASWNGSAPMFVAVQGSAWDITPSDVRTVANSLDKNKYIVVRPDHLFLLYKQQEGLGIPASPYVAAQPASQSANIGTNITFSVIATGTAPLSYQWRFNGTTLLNATNAAYAIQAVGATNTGNYSVVVTNSAGSASSSNALLTVIIPPTLGLQLSAGYPLLNLDGMLSNNFVVQYSSNLAGTNWVNLLSLTNLPASPYLFLDSGGVGQPARFYRAFMR